MDLGKVGTYHKDVALAFLLHMMDMDTRRQLMREHPAAYNALHGREIVRVVHADDGSPVA